MFDDTPDLDDILALFGSEGRVARDLFAQTSKGIPSGTQIATHAMGEALSNQDQDVEFIKDNFSALVADVQAHAYALYLHFERQACGAVLGEFLKKQTKADGSIQEAMIHRHFTFDRFFLSLTQSRRTRAGSTFETVVSALFKRLSYPYSPQPELNGSRPDYVLPSLAHYNNYATDCIVFTCKRTLRERWRQIVTEGMAGQAFFLATIDERLTASELERMKGRNVIVVVPKSLKDTIYPTIHNVVSFEDFFEYHLDPAMKRWKAKGII